MIILPAIDLMDNKVVRLRQGKADDVTIYSDDPVAVAKKWESQGAQWLHLVDLDGAFSGTPKNLHMIKKIIENISIPCELGGGLRDKKTIQAAFDVGISRIVLGSKACDSLEFVREMVTSFGGDKIAVGIDAKNGKVATKGWTETSTWDALTLAQSVTVAGAETIIYTDISTDGMLQGPNIPAMREMVSSVDAKIIASGGVGNLQHVQELSKISNLYGVIIGKALYDEKIYLPEVLSKILT